MLKYTAMIFATLISAACASNVPQAENFSPVNKQKKVEAAQHWGMIANDAVVQTRLALTQRGVTKDKPLFVADNNNTDFSRAFRKYMIAGLLDDGFNVSSKKEGATEVNYEAQIIRHAGAFDPLAFGYKPGYATAGAAGFWVLRDAFKTGLADRSVLLATGSSLAYDAYKATNPGETPVELLITTTIIHEDRYLMLNADAYYIENGEAKLFEECKSKNKRYCR